MLLEDGFIRSIGLGVNGATSFSLVEDAVGIYYDATAPSYLESILNEYDFKADNRLMENALYAMDFMRKYHVSKYNNAADISDDFFENDNKPKVLVVAQTLYDSSLIYGLAGDVTTRTIVDDAIKENPNASVYLKMHPDVLSGKKRSDINIGELPEKCHILKEDVNSISLLKHFSKVYTKTSGMGMEALILGIEVVCYGMPYYAGWGLTKDKHSCKRRKRKLTVEELFAGTYIRYTRYYNPFREENSDIVDTMKTIVKYRNLYEKNEGRLYFFGFSRWKRKNVRPFFKALDSNGIYFCTTLQDAHKKGLDLNSKIYIWGKKLFYEVEVYAKNNRITVQRVEDGFVRSLSLGSDLTKAYSLVADSRGIYFDPTQESDLEHLLNSYNFDEQILERAKKLQKFLIEHKLSKYNMEQEKRVELCGLKNNQVVVMVPGQVEDDASIFYGAKGMTNLQLLKLVRKNRPDAYLIYKPHPDVLSGNRKGSVDRNEVLKFANKIISDVSLDSVLLVSDEVHTMTSLVGFEALIRGKKVTTYGLPFYAGWGLTTDMKVCKRRTVQRTLNELVAAVFILYPRYINPKNNCLCEIEVLLDAIKDEKTRYNTNLVYRFAIRSRNIISRKIKIMKNVLFAK